MEDDFVGITNYWASLHEHGSVAGFVPVLVMDVWEHAFLLDAFFANIDWNAVDLRMLVDAVSQRSAA
jgi:superoxide dismutase, Fe-Mn family